MTTDIVSLKRFDFIKELKELRIASEYFGGRFPTRFIAESSKTGRQVEFTPVKFDDPRFDQDQWDGELQVYAPSVPLDKVQYAVVYHQW